MCKNLVEKGQLDNKPLIIFNRTQKRAKDMSESLPSGKSTVASSIDEAVSESDIIFTCVGDDAAINETIDTALKSSAKGKLFVDCSTVHPDTTEGLAKKASAAGGEFGNYTFSIAPQVSRTLGQTSRHDCPLLTQNSCMPGIWRTRHG
jgi:3-hydroxyisobutyrate dehydrogenase-like beta-hydroxyacid dehydrogenase